MAGWVMELEKDNRAGKKCILRFLFFSMRKRLSFDIYAWIKRKFHFRFEM